MIKQKLNITRYKINRDTQQYYLYLLPKENYLDFCIEKDGYANIYHMTEIESSQLKESIEDFIKNNINEWLEILEDIIED